jgi:hypothetical protein
MSGGDGTSFSSQVPAASPMGASGYAPSCMTLNECVGRGCQ